MYRCECSAISASPTVSLGILGSILSRRPLPLPPSDTQLLHFIYYLLFTILPSTVYTQVRQHLSPSTPIPIDRHWPPPPPPPPARLSCARAYFLFAHPRLARCSHCRMSPNAALHLDLRPSTQSCSLQNTRWPFCKCKLAPCPREPPEFPRSPGLPESIP